MAADDLWTAMELKVAQAMSEAMGGEMSWFLNDARRFLANLASKADRSAHMDELVRHAEEHGLYEQCAEPVDTRPECRACAYGAGCPDHPASRPARNADPALDLLRRLVEWADSVAPALGSVSGRDAVIAEARALLSGHPAPAGSPEELDERCARAASIAWENADDGPDEWLAVARAVLDTAREVL